MAITKVEPHTVTLAGESVLVLDYDAEAEQPYRIAYYSRKIRKGRGNRVSEAKFDDLVRRGILPRGYHTSWLRTAVLAKELEFGLTQIKDSTTEDLDIANIMRYVRSTGWGCELP